MENFYSATGQQVFFPLSGDLSISTPTLSYSSLISTAQQGQFWRSHCPPNHSDAGDSQGGDAEH